MFAQPSAHCTTGIVGLTNELDGRLVAQCRMCLFSLDRRLAAAWIASLAALSLEELDEAIRELLKQPEI